MKEQAIELMTDMSNFFTQLSTKFYRAAKGLSKGASADEVIEQLDVGDSAKEINQKLKELFTLLIAMSMMEGDDDE